MHRINLISSLLFLSICLFAQNEEQAIKKVLNNYIEGTAYTKPALLKNAFHEDAQLFFSGKNNTLFRPSIDQYIAWFEKEAVGTSTNRSGEIVFLDIEGDMAYAKLEIYVPKDKWLFKDNFLLRRIEGNWQIVSKAAVGMEEIRAEKRILFVVSNASYYGESEQHTSNHFTELVLPYDEFKKAGYQIDFVSPLGGEVPIGYINYSYATIQNYLYDFEFMSKLKNTKKPNEIDPTNYEAIFYGGGGAAMFGIPENEAIQQIANSIYEDQNGVVSAVCHGTAGIVNIKSSNGTFIIKGKKINGFPDKFEDKTADYFKTFPFSIQEKVIENGGDFKFSEEGWDGYTEEDGRIITGQDPYSAREVAAKVIKALSQLN